MHLWRHFHSLGWNWWFQPHFQPNLFCNRLTCTTYSGLVSNKLTLTSLRHIWGFDISEVLWLSEDHDISKPTTSGKFDRINSSSTLSTLLHVGHPCACAHHRWWSVHGHNLPVQIGLSADTPPIPLIPFFPLPPYIARASIRLPSSFPLPGFSQLLFLISTITMAVYRLLDHSQSAVITDPWDLVDLEQSQCARLQASEWPQVK
jgi:hypothetical protein